MFHFKKMLKNITLISYLNISHNDYKDCGRLECPAWVEICTIYRNTNCRYKNTNWVLSLFKNKKRSYSILIILLLLNSLLRVVTVFNILQFPIESIAVHSRFIWYIIFYTIEMDQ